MQRDYQGYARQHVHCCLRTLNKSEKIQQRRRKLDSGNLVTQSLFPPLPSSGAAALWDIRGRLERMLLDSASRLNPAARPPVTPEGQRVASGPNMTERYFDRASLRWRMRERSFDCLSRQQSRAVKWLPLSSEWTHVDSSCSGSKGLYSVLQISKSLALHTCFQAEQQPWQSESGDASLQHCCHGTCIVRRSAYSHYICRKAARVSPRPHLK